MTESNSPWVALSVILAFLAGGFIGWMVTAISCQPESCVMTAGGVGLATGIITAIGVGVVAALAVKSLGEWRSAAEQRREAPGPGCETGDDA